MEIFSSERAHLCTSVHGIAMLDVGKTIDKVRSKLVVVLFVNDHSFGRNTYLTSVHASSLNCRAYCQVDISIIKNDEGVIATKLHDCSLEIMSGFL